MGPPNYIFLLLAGGPGKWKFPSTIKLKQESMLFGSSLSYCMQIKLI
jgi:hypothetical protein